ncbi:MAG: dihydroorotate dehydrogenase [Spirochaetia bacterium]|uniref:Dihydroorotate dehydrogenase n=1 Tax=uncultured Spirochaetota bacterium TaxID=460511 RepID=A0A652ZXX5_9SPIR|nr:dihydroorotate dehydrogenase [Spirochaetia bacterium]MCE1208684.1 dihydroorotate dehydrogenase [Spirochaetia bacterium]VBB40646.1 Dihydroorotate dehydrogenase B (NAD(+)), catalytic subunit [uncultured Spirochaetota bacterium]HOI22662.1 dihydroorotate dehydrogenase [Spirochaetales bacterium]
MESLNREPDLRVRIGPLVLPNPVGVASGTFGYGQEYQDLVDIDALGALYTKAVSIDPKSGNRPPRLVETPSGLINSIGLANPGLPAFLDEKIPYLQSLGCPVVVNVVGETESEYTTIVEAIEKRIGVPREGMKGPVDGYELNLSCPNVEKGGMAFGTEPELVERITRKVRKITRRALVVKLSPNVTDIAQIALAAEAGKADAVSCINTVVGMAIDVKTCKPLIARGIGGLSGPAIRPIGVACVWKVARAVRIPVIGLGGIGCANDALEYLLAGASAIQVGTAIFSNPRAPLEILEGVKTWMRERGVEKLKDIPSLFRFPS